MTSLPHLLKGWSLFASLRNRALNRVASMICGSRVAVDWRNLKVFHPKNIRIGKNFNSGHSLWLESVGGRGQISIGDDVNFSDMVHIGSVDSVSIGDGVLVGSKVLITDHAHGRTTDILEQTFPNRRPIHSAGPVKVDRAAWLGDNVCILAGVTVGELAIVGANSVVTNDVPPATVWAGSPARQIWPPCNPSFATQHRVSPTPTP